MKRIILALTLTLMLSSVASARAVEDDGSFFTPVNMHLAAGNSAFTSSAGADEEGLKNPTNNITGQESDPLQMGVIFDMVLGLLNFGL